MNKYYKIITGSLVLICIILLIIFLIPDKNKDNKNDNSAVEVETKKTATDDILLVDVNDIIFKLKGATNLELDINDEYVEPGFIAYLKSGLDISDCVTINNDGITENGTYKIKYILEYENIKLTLTRKVTLKNNRSKINEEELPIADEKDDIPVETPEKSDDNITLKVNGDEVVHVLKGNLYKDMQASAIDKIDGDISSKIKANGLVNTNQIGEYTITYSVENSGKETKTVKRKIIVYDYEYSITANRTYNNKINMVFTENDNYIKYININGRAYTANDKSTIIAVDDNKEYTIKLIDKYGYTKEIKYNFIKPVLTCNATIDGNKTIVTVTSTSSNINKYSYYFNNQLFESTKNTYTISNSYNNVSVEAIDANNNSSGKISCKISETVQYFDSGLKELSYNGWNYYLYVPKNVKKNEKKPLIVFLHGSEERGNSLKTLDGYGFPKYIKSGQEYDAFVLVPQLPVGKYWANEVNTTMNLIKKVVNDYNIDENKISLSGFSLGAIGIPSIMKENQNYFSCVVMIAVGGNKKGYASYFKNIPVRFYAGSKDTRLGNSSDTKAFINAVKKVNNDVYSKVFSNAPHNVVDKTLKDGSVPNWMIAQTKK